MTRPVAAAPVPCLALVVAIAAACAGEPDPADQTADQEAARAGTRIDAVYDIFTRAYREADIRLLMDSVYGDSAFYLPPGSPILHGQDQFRGHFSFLERFARDGTDGPRISFDIVDRDISGDLAYDIGTYTIRPPDAPEGARSQGKFIVIWKRDEDGQWRIHADGFSPVR